MDRLDELNEEIAKSAGFQIEGQLDLLSSNFYMFDKNYSEWKKIGLAIKEPKIVFRLWDQRNRGEFYLMLNEATRLILNFLSSVSMLVAVSRNTVPKWYENTEFSKEYEGKKKAVIDDETLFVEDLRNYALHKQLPFVYGHLEVLMEEKKLDSKFLLSKSIFLKWDGLAKGKSYLSKMSEDEIDIELVIDSYYNKILGFHKWVFEMIREMGSKELEDLSKKRVELKELLKVVFGDDME